MTSIPLPILPPPVLVLLTAVGYAVATVGMKGFSTGHVALGLVLSLLGFLVAFAAEVVLMRQTELSVLYIAILAVETLLIIGFAFSIGEGFTMQQGMGALMVIAGLMVVSH